MKCARCGQETSGTYNEGGLLTAVCSDCEASSMSHEHPYRQEDHECIMCGSMMDDPGRFCSEECAEDYRYQNRTCDTCGGEFWDGGTSCTCVFDDEDFHKLADDYNNLHDA